METAAFVTFRQTTQNAVDQYQTALKTAIVGVAELEVQQLERQLAAITCSLIGYLSKTLLIAGKGLNVSDTDISAVCFLAFKILTDLELLKDMTEEEKKPLFLPYSATELPTALSQLVTIDLQPYANNVSAFVNSLCIQPSKRYTEQINANAISLTISGLSASIHNDALAADTAMAIDNEPTVDPKLLESLIKKEVEKALARQANQPSKKGARGAADNDTSASASLKKKQENDRKAAAGRLLAAARTKELNDQKAAAGRKAAVAARDTASATKQSNKGAKKRQSSKKSKP